MIDNLVFAHSVRNDLFIIQGLLKKLNIKNELVDKINEVINSIAFKCTDLIHPEKMNSESVDVNSAIEETLCRFTNIDFKKVFHEELHLACNKINFQDVLSNIILNSIQAGAGSIVLTTINKSLIITDSGSCTEAVVKKLNNGNIFTTKEHGSGIGSKNVREFFHKYNCRINYSISAYQSLIVRIKFP